MKGYKIRFRWKYLFRYGFYKTVANGFTLGPVLFYRPDEIVFYSRMLNDDDLARRKHAALEAKALAIEGWYQSIPYDFVCDETGFVFHADEKIDYNQTALVVEGVAKPLERKS